MPTGIQPRQQASSEGTQQLAHLPRSMRDLKEESPGFQAEGSAVGGSRLDLLTVVCSLRVQEKWKQMVTLVLEFTVFLLTGLFSRFYSEGVSQLSFCAWNLRVQG